MLGAIAGDVIGSIYEMVNVKTIDFPLFHEHCRFTDDTALTVALTDSLLHGAPFVDQLERYYGAYPKAGYGGMFHRWAHLLLPLPPASGGIATSVTVGKPPMLA